MPTFPTVQVVSYEALARVLSAPRLEAYRERQDEPDKVIIGRYRWNIALCMALYPALGLLEVTFRNSVHKALSAHYRSSAWYDGAIALSHRDQETVAQAKKELERHANYEKSEEPDRLVAQLMFGFWSGLLRKDYEELWRPLLSAVFPYMPKKERTRNKAAARFQELRNLRNRVSHHEPIYKQHNLLQRYDEIEEAIGWIEPAVLHMLPVGESFRDVRARGESSYRVDLDTGKPDAP